MTDLQELIAKSEAAYAAMTPQQRAEHDYAQRRSFIRGMCPSRSDFTVWCKVVDRILPALTGVKP